MNRRQSSLLAVIVAGLAVPTAAAAAPAPGTGTLVVRAISSGGTRLALPNAVVRANCPSGPAISGTTDTSGVATLGRVPSGVSCFVQVTPAARSGYGQRTPGSERVTVTSGGTTEVSIPLRIGATISGGLIGPGPTPQSGLRLELYGQRTGTMLVATSDAAGRYAFNGLPTDQYSIVAYPAGGGAETFWTEDVVAQVGTAAPTHVFAAPHYVHTTYDLWLALDGSDPDFPPVFRWDAATVTATNTATGATFTQVAGSTSAKRKGLEFVVPSGSYRIAITTPARTATSTSVAAPVGHYWYAGERVPLSTTAAGAVPVAVRYGTLLTLFAAAP